MVAEEPALAVSKTGQSRWKASGRAVDKKGDNPTSKADNPVALPENTLSGEAHGETIAPAPHEDAQGAWRYVQGGACT